MSRLQGGSQGEPEIGFTHPFFHSEVKATELRAKNNYGLRLLPAFDSRLQPGTPEFKASFIPYRTPGQVDKDGHEIFSDWYFTAKGYKFLGNEGRAFLSPLTKESRERRGVDPLFDCFLTAKNHSNADYKRLTVRSEEGEDYGAVLPAPKRFVFMNGLLFLSDEGRLENRVLIMTYAGLEDLKKLLNTYRPAHVQEVISPNYPNYLFGDVTDPFNGLWADAKSTVINNAGMKTSCLWFGHKRDMLQQAVKWPIDPNTADGYNYLTGRYDIGDIGGVTKIATAEEILDFIVTDGFLPYELIKEACGDAWTVPPDTARRHYSTPPQEDAPHHIPGARYQQPPQGAPQYQQPVQQQYQQPPMQHQQPPQGAPYQQAASPYPTAQPPGIAPHPMNMPQIGHAPAPVAPPQHAAPMPPQGGPARPPAPGMPPGGAPPRPPAPGMPPGAPARPPAPGMPPQGGPPRPPTPGMPPGAPARPPMPPGQAPGGAPAPQQYQQPPQHAAPPQYQQQAQNQYQMPAQQPQQQVVSQHQFQPPQQPQYQQPPAAPAQPGAQVNAPAMAPLTAEEMGEYNNLVAKFNAGADTMSPQEFTRFTELGDRLSAQQM